MFDFHLWIHLFLLNTDLTFSLPDTFGCISHTQCIHNHTLAKLACISWHIVVLESEQKCVTKLTWTEVWSIENKETLCQEQKTKQNQKKERKGWKAKDKSCWWKTGYTTQQTWHVMRVEVYLHTGHERLIISLMFSSFCFAWGRICFVAQFNVLHWFFFFWFSCLSDHACHVKVEAMQRSLWALLIENIHTAVSHLSLLVC